MYLQEISKKIRNYHLENKEDYKTWIINIMDFYTDIDLIKTCLSDEEIVRGQKIVNQEKRNLFFLRKGITRIILSRLLDINPYEIKYEYTVYGKQSVLLLRHKGLNFNISHSKEYLFVGVIKNQNIGVDIEKINAKLNYFLLADSVFSSKEVAIFNNCDKMKQIQLFYKTWVQKEAISKLVGLGLSIGFNKFSVNMNSNYNDEYTIENENSKFAIKIKVELCKEYVFAICHSSYK